MAGADTQPSMDHETLMWGNAKTGAELAEHVRKVGYARWLLAGISELQPLASINPLDTSEEVTRLSFND